ncbi:MAG TPA: zinc ABC transporter substrate-binding protein [Chloroflexota bacterium]|nr:zinc ABC transporter substrate-binding protein [Chloroflexota bacterium]
MLRILFVGLACLLALAACGGGTGAAPESPGAITIVAAENFYGDLASQIGGSHVKVTSILSDPSVDPHLYEASVDNAKAVAGARLVIKNGAGYDGFMDKLLAASPSQRRTVIDVSQLTGTPVGANPHLWYAPATMPKVAQSIASALSAIDPASRPEYEGGLQKFQTSLKPLQDEIATLKARFSGTKVLATEPVFDYMAEALGFDVVDKDGPFQKAVEDGTDPPASAVAEFSRQITSHAIRLVVYNAQAVSPMTTQMQNTAKQNGVPVVGVTETEPPSKSYQQWQLDQLQEVAKALGG